MRPLSDCGTVVWKECMGDEMMRQKLSDDFPDKEKHQYWTVYWKNGSPLNERDSDKSCDQWGFWYWLIEGTNTFRRNAIFSIEKGIGNEGSGVNLS